MVLGGLIISSQLVFGHYIIGGYWALYHISPESGLAEPLLIHWPAITYPLIWMLMIFLVGVAVFSSATAQIIVSSTRQ